MTRHINTPPFIECPDNLRCGQTILMMILNHFLPKRKWTFADTDKICQYVEGRSTNSSVAALGMLSEGFEVINFSSRKTDEYIADPIKYIKKHHSKKLAKYILETTDIALNIRTLKKLQKASYYQHIQRNWTWKDIDTLLDNGFLIMAWVDSQKLYARHSQNTTALGHFVLVYGYTKKYQAVMFHDGGSYLKTEDEGNYGINRWKSARIGLDHFMNAAKSKNAKTGSNIVAFRLHQD